MHRENAHMELPHWLALQRSMPTCSPVHYLHFWVGTCSTCTHTHLFSTHSDICVLVKGPWISASSLFSHLYSHMTASITGWGAEGVLDDVDTGWSENMSTGSVTTERDTIIMGNPLIRTI